MGTETRAPLRCPAIQLLGCSAAFVCANRFTCVCMYIYVYRYGYGYGYRHDIHVFIFTVLVSELLSYYHCRQTSIYFFPTRHRSSPLQ